MTNDPQLPPPNPERVAEVVEAYRVTGMVPARGQFATESFCRFTNGWDCGCGMGVLCAAENPSGPESVGGICNWCEEKFGTDYTQGFIEGFDGEQATLFGVDDEAEFLQGYADGRASAAAVGLEVG